jgi:hypothetical protein
MTKACSDSTLVLRRLPQLSEFFVGASSAPEDVVEVGVVFVHSYFAGSGGDRRTSSAYADARPVEILPAGVPSRWPSRPLLSPLPTSLWQPCRTLTACLQAMRQAVVPDTAYQRHPER